MCLLLFGALRMAAHKKLKGTYSALRPSFIFKLQAVRRELCNHIKHVPTTCEEEKCSSILALSS